MHSPLNIKLNIKLFWSFVHKITAFLLQVKTGLFAEHSNQLWNISAVPSWTKVNGGLIKMYKAEVSVFISQSSR